MSYTIISMVISCKIEPLYHKTFSFHKENYMEAHFHNKRKQIKYFLNTEGMCDDVFFNLENNAFQRSIERIASFPDSKRNGKLLNLQARRCSK